jgi:hypothetical protein
MINRYLTTKVIWNQKVLHLIAVQTTQEPPSYTSALPKKAALKQDSEKLHIISALYKSQQKIVYIPLRIGNRQVISKIHK